MLKSVLGLTALEKGLQYYLKKFKYSNAVTDDLWNCLSHQVAEQTVRAALIHFISSFLYVK